MEAELYRGKLIKVDANKLVFEAPDGGQDTFPSEVNIDEAWVKTYLGVWLECTVIDGVIKAISPP